MAETNSLTLPKLVRILAVIGFAAGTILALAGVQVTLCVLACAVCFAAWALATRRIATIRAHRLYALLARIGDGELGASIPDSTDEPTLRLQRGIARAQRGYAQALATAELERDELRLLVGAIQTGLLTLDIQLRITSASEVAEKMLSIASHEYRGRLLAEVIRQPDFLRFVEAALQSKVPMTGEVRLTGGTVESLVIAADPMRDNSGATTGLLLAIDDTTQLRRLENVRTDFAANVSHELRTPITNIKGYLETLMQIGSEDPSQVEHFLAVIHRNTNRLSTLVEDILLLAFLDQPRAGTALDFTDCSVLGILQDASQQLELVAAAKEMSIEIRGDASSRFVANAGLITQALVNLISNALKFSPPKSRVLVTAETDDSTICIQVCDQGPGIDPIHLPRLFERFYRVDRARSRELGGTGLGLSIVKHIAMVHGGSVDLTCPESGGTTVSMRIPRAYRSPNET